MCSDDIKKSGYIDLGEDLCTEALGEVLVQGGLSLGGCEVI
jgi:hypothetical protein